MDRTYYYILKNTINEKGLPEFDNKLSIKTNYNFLV